MKIEYTIPVKLTRVQAEFIANHLYYVAMNQSPKAGDIIWDPAQNGYVTYDGDKQIGIVKL